MHNHVGIQKEAQKQYHHQLYRVLSKPHQFNVKSASHTFLQSASSATKERMTRAGNRESQTAERLHWYM